MNWRLIWVYITLLCCTFSAQKYKINLRQKFLISNVNFGLFEPVYLSPKSARLQLWFTDDILRITNKAIKIELNFIACWEFMLF